MKARYSRHKVQKTMVHGGSVKYPQHAYIRMRERIRNRFNRVMGGFKHFCGSETTMAEVFEKYAIGAMEEALKAIIAEKKAKGGAE